MVINYDFIFQYKYFLFLIINSNAPMYIWKGPFFSGDGNWNDNSMFDNKYFDCTLLRKCHFSFPAFHLKKNAHKSIIRRYERD